MEILCVFAGIACVYLQHYQFALIPLVAVFFRPGLKFILYFFIGCLIASLHHWFVHEKDIPDQQVIKRTTLTGVVSSIPVVKRYKTQFELNVDTLDEKPVSTRVLLSCYRKCPTIHPGEKWSFQAKLKRPRNYQNPGSFNYQRFLEARHLFWTGYIRKAEKISDTHEFVLMKWRERAANWISTINQDAQSAGIFQALTLGVTTLIDKKEWDLFRRTGTIHLMVISGAHIGLVASVIYFLIFNLSRRSQWLCLYFPAQKTASLAALLSATIYALFAGFGVPAERALIMCFCLLLRNFSYRPCSTWQGWRMALLMVICYEPHSVLMPGFYLSFIAVAILLLVNQRVKAQGFKKILVMQCACMVGLMPFTLYWFSYGAVNGLIANLVAVPWVGFFIIPLALLVLVLGQFLNVSWLLFLLKENISGLIYFLSWVDSLAMVNIHFSFNEITYPLLIIVVLSILLFLPRKKLLPPAALMLFSASHPAYEKVPNHQAVIDVLDVGQGLAVVIRTAHHTIIYDTGVKFSQSTDMGKMVIIPFLETLGIKKLDKIIVSHPDLDHRGGLLSLQEYYPLDELIVDAPSYYKQGVSCHLHQPWVYDGVQFEFLPMDQKLKSKNNHSCILKVTSGAKSMLLTGDVERRGESHLVKMYGKKLNSDVLLIPHHSSKSSSSKRFVRMVSPQYAVSSYGFDNRYRFPHKKTILTYQEENISVYNTAEQGKVRIILSRSNVCIP